MKKYLAARKRLSTILMAGALGTFTFVAPQSADAQNAPEKIQLMAETLRARDSGNLSLAKEKAEELIKIAPNDENVQRLLTSINNDIDRSNGKAVYGQSPAGSVEVIMAGDADGGASAIVAAAAEDQKNKIKAAEKSIDEAEKLVDLGAYSDASALLDATAASLTLNTTTAKVLEDLDEAQSDVVVAEAKALAAAGDSKGAERLLEEYRAGGNMSKSAQALAAELDQQIANPYQLDMNDISPDYVAQTKLIRDLLTEGRAQYLNNDFDGAVATFNEVEARDANNAEAKLFQTRIAELLGDVHARNRQKTREQMLTEVDQAWERPKVFDIDADEKPVGEVNEGILAKLKGIVIPQVNFSGMELTRVIDTLSELSVEYDPDHIGVNIVPLFDANQANPRVNISLRNLNLDRILEFVTQQVNFAYSVGEDAVTVDASDSLGGETSNLHDSLAITRSTVVKLTGVGGGGGASVSSDPFAAPSGGGGGGSSLADESAALRDFFQSAGVNFDLPGTSLAYDGDRLFVTQTSRNLERMRAMLRVYNTDVKQVEIETKFLEVAQGDIDALGFNWDVQSGGDSVFTFGQDADSIISSFSSGSANSNVSITVPPLDPQLIEAGAPSFGDAGIASAVISSVNKTIGIGGYDADVVITALSRKKGTDLMSAPKITVISGEEANIVVAQEMIYPQEYGDIESTVSSGSSNDGVGGGGISITAGTPQDFTMRNVGVEMTVTPTVEEDNSINLNLRPRVTEFEGFVEYGGPSVAIQGSTTVTVPSGFYQPIFSVREITTQVTIYDGATVVMGGLTREEVTTVKDKVPYLGDIPGIGRLFRSEGESREKRNLLIFVTANRVSPGGSPAAQTYRNVNANSMFQNPTIMTPSGNVNRSIGAGDAE